MQGDRHSEAQTARFYPTRFYMAVNIVFAVLFCAVPAVCVFANPGAGFSFQWYWLLVAAASGGLSFFLLSAVFCAVRRVSLPAECVAAALVLGAFFALCLAVGLASGADPAAAGEFGAVFRAAAVFANTGAAPDLGVLRQSGSAGFYYLLAGLFSWLHAFGIADFAPAAVLLNAACLTGMAVLLYFFARHVFGVNLAFFSLALAFLSLVFFAFTPLVCAESVCLPLVTGAALLWVKTRDVWRAEQVKAALWRFCVLSALLAAGALLKPLVALVWVAVALDFLFLLRGKHRFLTVLCGFGAFAIVLAVGCGVAFAAAGVLPFYFGEPFPATAGLLSGAVAALADAPGASFGDGLFGAGRALGAATEGNSVFQAFFADGGQVHFVAAYLAVGAWLGIMVWAVAGAVKSALRQNYSLGFLRVVLCCTVVFVLLFGGSTRYVIVFLPFLILCALEAACVKPRLRPELPAHMRTVDFDDAEHAANAGSTEQSEGEFDR